MVLSVCVCLQWWEFGIDGNKDSCLILILRWWTGSFMESVGGLLCYTCFYLCVCVFLGGDPRQHRVSMSRWGGHHCSAITTAIYTEGGGIPGNLRPPLVTTDLTLMLLVDTLANTKWCENPEKWPKPWQMGTHLRVLSENYPMNTNMTGFGWFSQFCTFLCFGRKWSQHCKG